MADISILEEEFGLSKLGFLPQTCIIMLPPENPFYELESIAENLAELNKSFTLGKELLSLKLFPKGVIKKLDEDEQRRLYVILAMIIHSLLHGSKAKWDVLDSKSEMNTIDCEPSLCALSETTPVTYIVPEVLAYPFVEVCVSLDLPPVLTAAATDLWNWKLKDESEPISFSNLSSITTMTGTSTEISFHMIPCMMQVLFAPVIMRIYNGPDLILNKKLKELKLLLDHISDVVERCRQVFSSVGKNVDANIFYHVQRPLLAGFYPNEITLEGTEDIKLPSNWISIPKGPSAGQSTIFLLLDSFLGIDHGKIAEEFQEEMIHYMPRRHKHMVLKFQEKMTMSVRHFIIGEIPQSPILDNQLKDSYNKCIHQISLLRKFHLNVATRYLSVTKSGTGASTFRILLKECIDDTEKCTIQAT